MRTDDNRHVLDDEQTSALAVASGDAFGACAFTATDIAGHPGIIADHKVVIGHFFLSVDRHNEPTAGYSFSEYPCDPVEHWCSPSNCISPGRPVKRAAEWSRRRVRGGGRGMGDRRTERGDAAGWMQTLTKG